MKKILVCESELEILSLLAELLNLYGFCTITTTSSAQGYEITKQEKPDLILCGHSSRHLNSYETCWKFLQKNRQDIETANIPFIFMTGMNLDTILNWQNYLKYQDILFKPFNSQILLEKIYTHLLSYPKNQKSSDYKEFTALLN